MREPVEIKITDGGQEIAIRITPFDAYRGAIWGAKAALLLGVPAFSSLRSMNGEEVVSRLAGSAVNFDEVKPLLDELLGQCERSGIRITAQTAAGQLSDPDTVFMLWVASFKVSFGFFFAGGGSGFREKLNSTLKQLA